MTAKIRPAKRLTKSEREILSELYAQTCEGDKWNPMDTDFHPVRVGNDIGFDNGFGYVWTANESFQYKVE